MSEPFPTLDELRNVQNAVERDRVIRETWEALVAAVEEWDRVINLSVEEPHMGSQLNRATYEVAGMAIAYVKARKGNE